MLCEDAVVNHLKHMGVFSICLLGSPAFTLTHLDQGLIFSFTKIPVIFHVLNVSKCVTIHNIVFCFSEEFHFGNCRLATKVGIAFIISIKINRTDKLVTFSDIQKSLICTDLLKYLSVVSGEEAFSFFQWWLDSLCKT